MASRRLLRHAWTLLRDTLSEFYDDNILSRGASLAFFTIFAMAPLVLVAISVAGLFFGRAAAQGAVQAELSDFMGRDSAQAIQVLLQGGFRHPGAGLISTAIGVVTLLVLVTGVFVELQTTLNEIWKVKPSGSPTWEIIRGRVLSLGLVAALGFLLIVSLSVSAALRAAGAYLDLLSTTFAALLHVTNFVVSFALLAVMFAAIYKILPDRDLVWRDVGRGAVVTAVLFTSGKFLISLYIGGSAIASSYGSAGSLIAVLLWVYYSVLIFFLGAEFTKVFAIRHGSAAAREPTAEGTRPRERESEIEQAWERLRGDHGSRPERSDDEGG